MKYPTEWKRHRGSKSMPKCLEGMWFEVELRDGSCFDVYIEDNLRWTNDNQHNDIISYRILGPIEQAPDAVEPAQETESAPAPEQPTIEKLIILWQLASDGVKGLERTLAQCKSDEQAAREAVQKALADAGWGDASTEPEKPSRSGQEVVWGEWEGGDVVVFDWFTTANNELWDYKIGEKYTVINDRGVVAPVAGDGSIPSANYGFRFIWP